MEKTLVEFSFVKKFKQLFTKANQYGLGPEPKRWTQTTGHKVVAKTPLKGKYFSMLPGESSFLDADQKKFKDVAKFQKFIEYVKGILELEGNERAYLDKIAKINRHPTVIIGDLADFVDDHYAKKGLTWRRDKGELTKGGSTAYHSWSGDPARVLTVEVNAQAPGQSTIVQTSQEYDANFKPIGQFTRSTFNIRSDYTGAYTEHPATKQMHIANRSSYSDDEMRQKSNPKNKNRYDSHSKIRSQQDGHDYIGKDGYVTLNRDVKSDVTDVSTFRRLGKLPPGTSNKDVDKFLSSKGKVDPKLAKAAKDKKQDNKAKESSMKEGLGDLAHMAELDHEVQMARSDLYKIAKYAIKLHDMLKGVSEAEGLEGWVQSKITKAADYMGSVYHNMDYDTKFAEKNKPMEIPLETRQEYHGSLGSRLSERLSASDIAAKKAAGTFNTKSVPSKSVGPQHEPLTPGVRVSGKMIKYEGKIYQFAGRGMQAPQGERIVVPPQALGFRPKFPGQGKPVIIADGKYYPAPTKEAVVEYDDRILRMAKKQGAAAGKKVAQNISMGGPGKWAKPFKTTKGPNDYEWTGIDPKTGMGTYTVDSYVKGKGGTETVVTVTTTVDKFGRIRNTTANTGGQSKGDGPAGTHDGNVGDRTVSGADDTRYDKMGRKTSQASQGIDVKQTAPGVHKVDSVATDYNTSRMSRGVVNKNENMDEASPNNKIYDKCWKGYKKVPGKKRGEKGSCVKA